jgi:hypothetical protein
MTDKKSAPIKVPIMEHLNIADSTVGNPRDY